MRLWQSRSRHVLIGILLGLLFASPSIPVISLPSGTLVPAVSYAWTCANYNNLASSVFTGAEPVERTDLKSVSAYITYDPTNTLSCGGPTYFYTGIYVSGSTSCGGFAQWGYIANKTGGFKPFSYTTLANNTYWDPQKAKYRCDFGVITYGNVVQNQTYEVDLLGEPYAGCSYGSSGGLAAYYLNGTFVDQHCVDWARGQNIQELTERYGAANYIGGVDYENTRYCSSTSAGACSPNTTLGTYGWAKVTSTDPDWDPNGRTDEWDSSWPQWSTCDVRQFSSGTC